MQTENKGAETPKTEDKNLENVRTLQDEEETMTAKEVMNLELEDLDTICSILDRQNLNVLSIREVNKNHKKFRELVCTVPRQTVYWAIQRYDIYDRFEETKFFDWHNSKKELTGIEYRDLVCGLNKGKDGISLSELTILTHKDENQLFQDLRAGCGLSVVNCSSCTEFVMEDYLYVRLIPIVNENNQLTDEIRTQYLLKANAIQLLAEYWEDDYIADVYC